MSISLYLFLHISPLYDIEMTLLSRVYESLTKSIKMEAKVLFLLPLGVALLIPGPYQLQEFLKMLPRFISQLQR